MYLHAPNISLRSTSCTGINFMLGPLVHSYLVQNSKHACVPACICMAGFAHLRACVRARRRAQRSLKEYAHVTAGGSGTGSMRTCPSAPGGQQPASGWRWQGEVHDLLPPAVAQPSPPRPAPARLPDGPASSELPLWASPFALQHGTGRLLNTKAAFIVQHAR